MLKKICLIFLLSFAFFSPYLLTDTEIKGADSYAFLNFVCRKDISGLPENLSLAVFSFFPCSLLFIKLFQFLILFTCLTGFYFLLNNKKISKLVFLLATPIFSSQFFFFEDDLIGLPFFIWGLVFFWGFFPNKNKKIFQGIGFLLFLLGLLLWHGGIVFVFLTSFLHAAVGFLFLPTIFFNLKGFLNYLIGANAIENSLFIGVFLLFPLLFFIYKIKKRYIVPTIVGVFLTAINAKMGVFVVPFLFSGLCNWGKNKTINSLIILFFFIECLISYAFFLQISLPNNELWKAIDFLKEKSEELGKPIKNEWSYGYWLRWKGIDTNSFGGGGVEVDCNASVCLVSKILAEKKKECVVLKEFNGGVVIDC